MTPLTNAQKQARFRAKRDARLAKMEAALREIGQCLRCDHCADQAREALE